MHEHPKRELKEEKPEVLVREAVIPRRSRLPQTEGTVPVEAGRHMLGQQGPTNDHGVWSDRQEGKITVGHVDGICSN